jgi:hypothetical protein
MIVMNIARTKALEGSDSMYTYEPDDFGLLMMAHPTYNLELIDDLIIGLALCDSDRQVMIETRNDALQAYKAGNIPLMLANLKTLDRECRVKGLLPDATAGRASKRSYLKRDHAVDKRDFIALVLGQNEVVAGGWTLREWCQWPKATPYFNLYKGRQTISGWFKDAGVVLAPEKKGRPRKATVTA